MAICAVGDFRGLRGWRLTFAVSGWRMVVGGWWFADDGLRMEVCGWRFADGDLRGLRLAFCGGRFAVSVLWWAFSSWSFGDLLFVCIFRHTN